MWRTLALDQYVFLKADVRVPIEISANSKIDLEVMESLLF